MPTMSINTLEILEAAEIPPAHARAIAKAIESDFTHRLDDLVTKSDFSVLRLDISEFKAASRLDLAELRRDLETRLESVKAELVRWVFLAVVSVIPIFSGITYFLVQHAVH
jgi:hypothetical protein